MKDTKKYEIKEGHKPYTPLYDFATYKPLYDHKKPYIGIDKSVDVYDAIFVGGGAAGRFGSSYVKAGGGKVLVVDKDDHLGGKCPKNACVPHHVFFDCAVELDLARWMGGKLWFEPFDKKVEIRPIMRLIQQGHEPVYDFMFHQTRNQIGVDVIMNMEAQVLDANTVKVGEQIFKTKNIVLATGSGPAKLGIPGEDLPGVLDYTNLQSINYEPNEVLVVGASKVGAPYSSFFNACGMKTTLVDMFPFFRHLDKDIREFVIHNMKLRGMNLFEETTLKEIGGNGHVEYAIIKTPQGEKRISCDTVFIAAGAKPNTDTFKHLGLNMKPNGEIVVNERMQTNIPGIYATGDAIGAPMEMWKARQSGMVAAKNILGEDGKLVFDRFPDFMHTTYEISWYGLTEEEARGQYGEVFVIQMPIGNYGQPLPLPVAERTSLFAHAFPEMSGIQKAIFDNKSRRLVGIWHVGYGAKDSFQYLAPLMDKGLTIDEMATFKELFLNPTHFIQLSRLRAGQKNLVDLR